MARGTPQHLQKPVNSPSPDEDIFHIATILLTYSGPAPAIASLPSRRIPLQQIVFACSHAQIGDVVCQLYSSDICIVMRPKVTRMS